MIDFIMLVTEIRKIENCLEGKNVREIFLDMKISKALVAHLAIAGKVVIHDFKPKPFFTVIIRGKYTIKGSLGNRHARVILPDNSGDDFISEIKDCIEGYGA